MSGILVVQTAFLGDVVLTTPLLRELKRARPAESLTVLTTAVGAQVLEGLSFVDHRIVLDKRGPAGGALATARLARQLRKERFSTVVAAQRSLRTGLISRVSGAATRIGFRGAAGAFAYTARVRWNASDHAVLRYLELASPVGGRPALADPNPQITVLESAQRSVATLLRAAGVEAHEELVALAPGSVWGTKRWTVEGFTEVARSLRARGFRAVLVGSGEERALCETVATSVAGAVVLAGRTLIQQLVAVLARCRALVANDSGPGHIAAAVGTPVLTIFGPTVPAFGYAPFGASHRIVQHETLECRPCHRHGPAKCPLGHHRCMRDLGSEHVLRALDEMLPARNYV